VDKIGGLDAAIKEAAVLGKKKKYTTQNYQNTTKMLTIFLQASFCPKKISSNKKLARKL
jgi:ClpP class serine protease